jgi:hypothetical protein
VSTELDDVAARWAFETKQIHVGSVPDTATSARVLPTDERLREEPGAAL